jgi:putative exosortase-associated protein (TIGR04073 family)
MKSKTFLRSVGLGAGLCALLLAGRPDAAAQEWTDKIQRGFANLTSGVVEIPGCITDLSRKNGPLMGLTVGFFKGVGMVPVRTAVGLFEFLTFYAPIPANYDPVLKPATPYNYWDEQ